MTLTALVVFVVGLVTHLTIWSRGRRADASAGANFGSVARAFVIDGLLHARAWREDKLRWTMHAALFWGFLLLLVTSALSALAVNLLIPHFNVHNPLVDALADKDTAWLAFANELGGVAILVGAGIAIARRYMVKLPHLRTQNQDTLLLAFLAAIVLTGYPLESFRLLAEHVPASRAAWSFVGYSLALVIAPLNAPWALLYNWLFVFHAAIASAFIAYIPFGKAFHILASPLVAARPRAKSLEPQRAQRSQRFRNSISSRPLRSSRLRLFGFGLSELGQHRASVGAVSTAVSSDVELTAFSFRQLMELDACTRCGECVAWCPTFAEARDESIHPLGKIAREKEILRAQYGLRARVFGARKPNGALAEFSQGTYHCTLCARCAAVCPVGIQTRDLWLSMREQFVAMGVYPDAFNRLRDAVTSAHNLGGEPNENRVLWADNLEAKPDALRGKRNAETVYFIGCVAAMYPAAYGIPQSFAQTLARAGVDFTTLGGAEWCCGFPLILAGMRDAAMELMRHNVETVRAMGAKRLVASCPSCYHTWHSDYPAMLGEPLGFEVLHSTQLLADLVERKQIALGPLEQTVTYHDPCDLGRTSGIFDEPRYVLEKIPGVQLIEMQDHRERALCCGGGGDVEMADPELTAAVARRRLGQAQATGAPVIVSACQQCKRTMAGAARAQGMQMRVLDVTEVVWSAVSAGR